MTKYLVTFTNKDEWDEPIISIVEASTSNAAYNKAMKSHFSTDNMYEDEKDTFNMWYDDTISHSIKPLSKVQKIK